MDSSLHPIPPAVWDFLNHLTDGRTAEEISRRDGWMRDSPNGDEQWMFDAMMRAAELLTQLRPDADAQNDASPTTPSVSPNPVPRPGPEQTAQEGSALDAFDRAWMTLEALSRCDAKGGVEYQRVRFSWDRLIGLVYALDFINNATNKPSPTTAPLGN